MVEVVSGPGPLACVVDNVHELTDPSLSLMGLTNQKAVFETAKMSGHRHGGAGRGSRAVQVRAPSAGPANGDATAATMPCLCPEIGREPQRPRVRRPN